ncbi:MAG: methylated-DNA--[protein]-cysteine S-methyltransferase [Candidatus Cryptobacteroides sp.]
MPTARPTFYLQYYNSPCGEMLLGSLGDELWLCDWIGRECAERSLRRIGRQMEDDFSINGGFRIGTSAVLERTKMQLNEYFAGKRRAFDIPLHPVGTEFQRRVWMALTTIPYGETRSYKEIAASIGNPQGIRAVAKAIGTNAICILIPCHRVIGSNSSLTGFSGGLETKKHLLDIEQNASVKD